LGSSAGNGGAGQFSIPGIQNDPTAPASVSIIASSNYGMASVFQYQLNNQNGEPLTGSGYYVAEYMSGDSGNNSNGHYISAPNGVVTDNVGFIIQADANRHYVATQTFTALYQGYFSDLSTVFQHDNIFNNGNYLNSVTVIQP
jgi:hypothetical protein